MRLPRRRRVSPSLARLLRRVRYEVIPTKSVETIEARVCETVPKDVVIAVTASPRRGLEATLSLAERLARQGYRTVPHIAARMVLDEVQVKEIVDRLRTAGVDDVFIPAGDADPPAGRFDAALPVLAELTALGRPFSRVGVTGYPESHPVIADEVVRRALEDKRPHATYVVSNLCFDPKTVAGWVHDLRRRGNTLPLELGIAGPAGRARLLAVATTIGVGESVRFLGKNRGRFARIALPGGYSPERLLRGVDRRTDDGDGLAGLHVYTFNQVAETERWRQGLLSSAG